MELPDPSANPEVIHDSSVFSNLFSTPVLDYLEGFECMDKDKMEELWPAGTDAAVEVCTMSLLKGEYISLRYLQLLCRFLHTKAQKAQIGDASPIAAGAEESSNGSHIAKYVNDRNQTDFDSSSRLR